MTAASSARATPTPPPRVAPLGRLRRLPVPDVEPPAQCLGRRAVRPPSVGGVQQVLDLGLVPRRREAEDRLAEAPAPTQDRLPDPDRWCLQFVQAAVEVLQGLRPAAQLVRWTTHEVQAAITRRAGVNASVRGTTTNGRRPVVKAVRTCPVNRQAVEASAVVLVAGRAHAVALRLEGRDNRWRATLLQMH